MHDSTMAETQNTLGPLAARYLTEQRKLGHMSSDTARRAGYRLARLETSFGRRPLSHLNRQAIEQWLISIEHLSPGTRRLNLSTAGTFCRWLVIRGAIRQDPTVGMVIRKPRSIPRALNGQQVARLTSSLPDDRAELIAALMLHLGLRCCEVARARVEDYDPAARSLIVVGKGGHQRLLPVPDEAAEVLDRYLGSRGVTAGPLVRSKNFPWRALTAGTVSTLMARWLREAGIKQRRFDGVGAHALRHTAASDTLERCRDLEPVREMLGHVSLTTTQIYLRRADLARLREAMEGRSYLSRPA